MSLTSNMRQPVLQGLHGKSAEHERDAKHSEAAFGEIVGVELDVRVECRQDAGDDAREQTQTDGECPCVIHVVDEGAAE